MAAAPAGVIEQRAQSLAEAMTDAGLEALEHALSLAARAGASPFKVPPDLAILRQAVAREVRIRSEPVGEKVAGYIAAGTGW